MGGQRAWVGYGIAPAGRNAAPQPFECAAKHGRRLRQRHAVYGDGGHAWLAGGRHSRGRPALAHDLVHRQRLACAQSLFRHSPNDPYFLKTCVDQVHL